MKKLPNFITKRLSKVIEESCKTHYNFIIFCIDNHIDITKLDLSTFENYMDYVNMYMRGNYDNIY